MCALREIGFMIYKLHLLPPRCHPTYLLKKVTGPMMSMSGETNLPFQPCLHTMYHLHTLHHLLLTLLQVHPLDSTLLKKYGESYKLEKKGGMSYYLP